MALNFNDQKGRYGLVGFQYGLVLYDKPTRVMKQYFFNLRCISYLCDKTVFIHVDQGITLQILATLNTSELFKCTF